MVGQIRMGDPRDFRNFMGAVIDEASFDHTMRYIELAKASPTAEILCGGKGDKRVGYFIEPTIILTTGPQVRHHGGGDLRAGAHGLCLPRTSSWRRP